MSERVPRRLKLTYLLPIADLPESCECKNAPLFTADHSQVCQKGGWVIRRHNDVRDLLARMIGVMAKTQIEPQLHPLEPNDSFHYRSANVQPDARSDILVEGLFGALQPTYIDVRIVHRQSATNQPLQLDRVLSTAEDAKKREYAERIQRVEGGSFVPFVATSTGILGKEAHALFQHLGRLMAEHSDEPLGATLSMMRTQLSFTFVRAAIHCLRGPRKIQYPDTSFLALSALFAAWHSRAAV